MSDEAVAEFTKITHASRADALIWLAQHDNDVGAAAAAYLKRGRKPREYYVGGDSHSGIAVLAGPEDGTIPDGPAAPPPPPPDPFAGKGRSLGAGAPPPPRPPPAAAAAPAPAGPVKPVKTDYSTGRAKTRIRFELPGQPPMVLTVDLTATVGDLRRYFVENYPPAAGHEIAMAVVTPPQELTDDSATVEEAKLKMAMIRCVW
jgi:hypothetical protein